MEFVACYSVKLHISSFLLKDVLSQRVIFSIPYINIFLQILSAFLMVQKVAQLWYTFYRYPPISHFRNFTNCQVCSECIPSLFINMLLSVKIVTLAKALVLQYNNSCLHNTGLFYSAPISIDYLKSYVSLHLHAIENRASVHTNEILHVNSFKKISYTTFLQ